MWREKFPRRFRKVAKHSLNENWQEGDSAHGKFEGELKRKLYPLIRSLSRVCYPEKKGGRPAKIDPAMAAFLAVAKEYGNENI